MTTYDGIPARVTTTRQPVDITTEANTPSELVAEIWRTQSPELRLATFAIIPGRPDVVLLTIASSTGD